MGKFYLVLFCCYKYLILLSNEIKNEKSCRFLLQILACFSIFYGSTDGNIKDKEIEHAKKSEGVIRNRGETTNQAGTACSRRSGRTSPCG